MAFCFFYLFCMGSFCFFVFSPRAIYRCFIFLIPSSTLLRRESRIYGFADNEPSPFLTRSWELRWQKRPSPVRLEFLLAPMKGVLNSLARSFRPKRGGIECLEISMPLTIRDHLASIYCMLILGIYLPLSRPMTFMASSIFFFFKSLAFQSCFFLFLKAWKLVDITFLSIVSSHWPAISHSFLISSVDPVLRVRHLENFFLFYPLFFFF